MNSCKWLTPIVFFIIAISCSSRTDSSLNTLEVEMIFWEQQSWEVGGGRSRLTIWADGRSEVMVVPGAQFQP